MRKVCVFCGSRSGIKPVYEQAAIALGQTLAKNKIAVVYGGAKSGLMGVLADTVLSLDGQVIGVMPKALADREILHDSLTSLLIVDSLMERKQKMIELADGFIALPGGTGTLDELAEVFCLAQIGEHQKPIAILDVDAYFQPWLQLFDHMVKQGFLKKEARHLLLVESEPQKLIQRMRSRLSM